MKNKQLNELAVCGFESVKALGEYNSDKITRLFFSKDRALSFGSLCKKLADRHCLYRMVEDDSELEKLSQSVHHQGAVAMISQPEIAFVTPTIIQNWIQKKERVLILDRVGNANNLGAIIRSAAFFGIRHIVLSADDSQATVTTSSYRVAQGGMEFVSLYSVLSIERLLSDTADKIISIAADHRSKDSLGDYKTIISSLEKGSPKGVFIVLGNEENGLSLRVTQKCTALLRIFGSNTIESLNVAQAATLFLYEMSR